MATDILVPTLGESITEATVAQWLKQPGEAVAADEPLVELETDKVTLEVNASAAGVLSEVVAAAGENVEVGALLGRIAEGEAAAAPAPAKAAKAEPAAAPAPTPAPALVPAPAAAGAPAAAAGTLSPAVRKLIEDNALDAGRIAGTGKGGRITKENVLKALEARAAAPAPAPVPAPAAEAAPREERVRMTRLRKRIAERLKEAQNTAAMLTTFNEADMSAVMALRAQYRDSFEKKHGVRLGFMSFFTKAAVAALKELPAVNAEIDGDDIVYKNHYDIGIAVGTPQGLVVPVIRDADRLGFSEIEKTIGALGRKARDGKLSIEEMTGGTFTITNGGVYGSLMSTPILNPPQSGILGMHKIQERPMAVDGEVRVRPMMYLALSYDHRTVDGREAVTFLVRIKDYIEDPQRLLIDM
ncbi:MAG: 2-oxoglutarate dehydrogenase complex dihydrolipoyllysine-residue succinyltransferase [Proteobacteria bacterium]|nr:2-oxoglutarate dehydrogenase complex dihydrolipoyllysine-residue succinyltransferase [Pseudomonadota bacterium]